MAPKLFNIYKFYSNLGWIHTSYKLGYSVAHILTLYPYLNNSTLYTIREAE